MMMISRIMHLSLPNETNGQGLYIQRAIHLIRGPKARLERAILILGGWPASKLGASSQGIVVI